MTVPPLTPGRLLYLFYHLPKAKVLRSARVGGPYEQWLDQCGAWAMRRRARTLPNLPFFEGPPLVVHQLTGRRYLTFSIFCLWSLGQASRRNLAPVFYDDGSLLRNHAARLLSLFPQGKIVRDEEIKNRVETDLPIRRFPVLRDRFRHYVHMRKLIGPHLGQRGWKLVLDADLLFFRRPDFLLDWLEQPQSPLHLQDVTDSYGYSQPLLEELASGPLPCRVNVGLCGLRSELLDWDLLEWWCARLMHQEGSHYLLEQALVALLLRRTFCAVPPPRDYLTLPDRDEVLAPRAVMHHYVAESKRWYLRHAWRVSCEQISTADQQVG